MKSITYKKYIEYSFLRYALSIIVILFIMMIAFLSVNFKVIENLENEKNTQKLLQVLEKQFLIYDSKLENLSTDEDIISLLSGGDYSKCPKFKSKFYFTG